LPFRKDRFALEMVGLVRELKASWLEDVTESGSSQLLASIGRLVCFCRFAMLITFGAFFRI
jgi:hypothetical protein